MSILGALGIGAAGSLLGGLLGSSSASRAARAQQAAAQQQRDYDERLYGRSRLGLLGLLGGSDYARRIGGAILPTEQFGRLLGRPAANASFTPEQQRRVAEIDQRLAQLQRSAGVVTGTNRAGYQQQIAALQRERDGLTRAAGGSPGVAGEMDAGAFDALGPGILSRYSSLANDFAGRGQSDLGRYDADTARLGQLSGDLTAQASRFGQGERSRIRREGQESLANANGAAQAALQARGLGASSFLTDALGKNAKDNFNATQDRLDSLGDRQIGLRTALGQGTLGLLSGRSSGRQALASSGNDREMQLRLGGLNTELSALRDVASPMPGNSAAYFPSASPSASSLGVLGGSLAAVSSPLLGYGLAGMTGGGGGAGGGGQPSLEELRRWAAMYGGVGSPYGR